MLGAGCEAENGQSKSGPELWIGMEGVSIMWIVIGIDCFGSWRGSTGTGSGLKGLNQQARTSVMFALNLILGSWEYTD